MLPERRLYVGPSLRRLRRDHGLTQADMAADLDVSSSYIALLERNHRPLSAEMLLRLSQTYKMDMAALAGDGGSDEAVRLQAILKDPMFTDIDLPTLETADVTTNFPGITEALLRLYTAYQEEQLALADRGAEALDDEHAFATHPVGHVDAYRMAECATHRGEGDAGGVTTGLGQIDAFALTHLAQERVRNLNQDARAVTGLAIRQLLAPRQKGLVGRGLGPMHEVVGHAPGKRAQRQVGQQVAHAGRAITQADTGDAKVHRAVAGG